jgi:transposase-like protein
MAGSKSKFTPDNCQAIVELIFDGVSISDAAREAGVNVKTVKNWLSKGRAEGEGPYADFAESVDRARGEVERREPPGTEEELRLVVWRAAKGGSVAAQKLYWEMLRASDDDEKEADPFDELDGDELAEARAKREAA